MFTELLNRKVKVVYKDGENVNAIKGILISTDNNLIRLKTNIGSDFYISVSAIQRINQIIKENVSDEK